VYLQQDQRKSKKGKKQWYQKKAPVQTGLKQADAKKKRVELGPVWVASRTTRPGETIQKKETGQTKKSGPSPGGERRGSRGDQDINTKNRRLTKKKNVWGGVWNL